LYWKEDYSSVNASIFIGGYFRNPPLIPAGAPWSAAAEVAARGKLAGDPNYRNTEHKSAYVTFAYDLTDQLEVSAEARYSEEQFDYLFGRALSLGVNAATGALTPATFAGSVFTPSSSTDFFAPKITVNYTPVDGKLIYATASKGVKPAGFLNVGVVLDANDAKYNPEELWNYELGFKTSWMDDRLRLNGALFQMKYTDRIAQLLVPDTRSPQGTSTLVRNQGEAKVDGAELEITAALSESVTLSAGYTYLDARFIESEVPNTSALGIAGSGNCRVGNVGAQVVCFTNTNGKSLEQSAKHALVAAISYSREMTNGWTLNGEISGQWRSKRFLSPDNLVWLPKHSNVDMQVGISNDKYTVVAYANNLFDFTGAISAQSYGDPYIAFPVAPPVLAYTTYPADPRQIGIRLGMKFYVVVRHWVCQGGDHEYRVGDASHPPVPFLLPVGVVLGRCARGGARADRLRHPRGAIRLGALAIFDGRRCSTARARRRSRACITAAERSSRQPAHVGSVDPGTHPSLSGDPSRLPAVWIVRSRSEGCVQHRAGRGTRSLAGRSIGAAALSHRWYLQRGHGRFVFCHRASAARGSSRGLDASGESPPCAAAERGNARRGAAIAGAGAVSAARVLAGVSRRHHGERQRGDARARHALSRHQ
jgi:hypothetical protein